MAAERMDLPDLEQFDEVIAWYMDQVAPRRDDLGPYWFEIVYTEVKNAEGVVRYELRTSGGLPEHRR